MVKLEIDKPYRDAGGRRYHIAGEVKNRPGWVYSECGQWFEQATGRRVRYTPKIGPIVETSGHNEIVGEARD